VDASCWVHNPQVRGSKPPSAILIFITLLLLLFIYFRKNDLFISGITISFAHIYNFYPIFTFSLLAFGFALKMRAISYTRTVVSLGSGLNFLVCHDHRRN